MGTYPRKLAQALSQDEKLERIIADRFPDVCEDLEDVEVGLQKGLTLDQAVQRATEINEIVDERERYEERLAQAWDFKTKTATAEQINSLYETLQQRRRAEQEARETAEDKHRFFNRPTATANFKDWGRRAYWTVEEATALCLGKEPTQVNRNTLRNVPSTSPFYDQFNSTYELIKRAAKEKKLAPPSESILSDCFHGWTNTICHIRQS